MMCKECGNKFDFTEKELAVHMKYFHNKSKAGQHMPAQVCGQCPDCGATLFWEEGCQNCKSCGYSKC